MSDDTPKNARLGIGAFCMELIKAGKTNKEVLAAVQEKFPEAKTSYGSIAFYRNKLKTQEVEAV